MGGMGELVGEWGLWGIMGKVTMEGCGKI